jgi:mono/diheme cytochrome c family protein/glucose/arabinose dehydrogenase
MNKKYALSLLLAGMTAWSQNGDKPGEVQAPPPATLKIPPAPPLSVEDALKTFQLAPGFRLEAVAAEPLIEAPVEIEFDADGRMYVVEMRGFMPNVEGKGENQPLGRISILEDTDNDGKMDKSTVFVDGLVLPRALAIFRGGLLVAEPPHLWFFEDTNGDGKADDKTEIASNYGTFENPEHTANGLLVAMDNWIYSANHTVRYRNVSGEWEQEPTTFRGQWGISQDDYGRLFFNSNSDQFRGDLVPTKYLARNPNYQGAFGANVQIAKSQAVFPGRVNPGVNRGYQKGQLRPDGTLATFTAACGPLIYRGGIFPEKFQGAGFLCEPTGNLVRCNLLEEKDGIITATNAFPNTEFLTSTDERFRPVNLQNGPDGALYIVDMHRGIVQHRIYVTTYLRNQALDRELDKHLNMGRVYRVVPEDYQRSNPVKLSEQSSADLIREFEHPNGWRRDTAQRLLVERRDLESAAALRKLATNSASPLAQFHALWTLEGMAMLNQATLATALKAQDGKVRAAAIRLSEPFLRAEGKTDLLNAVLGMVDDENSDVQLQLAFSLGEVKKPQAETALLTLTSRHMDNPLMQSATITGLGGREIEALSFYFKQPAFKEKSPGRAFVTESLARCVMASRNPASINSLLEKTADAAADWPQLALFNGMLAIIPPKGKNSAPQAIKPIVLPNEPAAFARLHSASSPTAQEKLKALDQLLVWKGKPGYVAAEVKPLTEKEKEQFETGKTLYISICGACHQPHGLGLEGLAPPLADSDWILGSEQRLIRIVLQGLRGPLNVKGKQWELEMPPLNILDDSQVSALLTYIRREWGHTASPVAEEAVAKVRQATAQRQEAWTEADLLKVK